MKQSAYVKQPQPLSPCNGEGAVIQFAIKHLFFHFVICFLFIISSSTNQGAVKQPQPLSPCNGERAVIQFAIKLLFFHFVICFVFIILSITNQRAVVIARIAFSIALS